MVNRPTLSPAEDTETESVTWIVFSNDTDVRLLRLLKKGYRHCFAIMQQRGQWVLIDPRLNKLDITILLHPPHFNLPLHFSNQGKTVVKVRGMRVPNKIAALWPCSCVETIKRLIGLHRWWAVTPYTLYRALKISNKKG